jgi:hypothetical protein
LPAAWDEIRFIEGDPASHIALARRKGPDWYLGGLNGTGSPRDMSIDLTQFGYGGNGGTCICDGSTPRTFLSGPITGARLDVTLSPWGGFVAWVPSPSSDVPTLPIDGPAVEEAEGRSRLSFDGILPSPFTAATRILYTLPGSAPTLLTIHDAAGRRVRTLVDAAQPAGAYSLSWDGTDGTGTPVAAGVYFCRLSAGERAVTRRVQRLR